MSRNKACEVASYTPYSQRDLRWSWKRVGDSRLRFYDFGCLLTCLAMMVGRRPDELNQILLAAGAFDGPNLRSAQAATILGLDYAGRSFEIENIPNISPTIREVDYTRDGGEFVRHFVLQMTGGDGTTFVVDPYGGVKRPLDYYSFVSYRLFARRPLGARRGETASSQSPAMPA